MLRYDVNSGPLTLIHDLRHLPKEEIDKLNATPRSLDQNLNNHASSVGNFRIKGFVNNNFVKASFPRTIPAEPILPRSDDPKVDLSPPRSNTQPQAPLSPPHHPPPPEMNGYHNQAPVFDRQNGYAPATNGHIMNGHSHDNGWARERPSPRYDSQDNPLSYRSVNQHQGTGRNFSEDYENTQTVPIRNAYAKTDDQIKKETRQFLDRQDEEKRYKEESVNKLREKHEEQRRTRQMMEESGPFGKPGAGAPNGNDYKKQKFREEQFYGHEQPKYQVEPNPDMAREQDQGLDGMPAFNSPGRNNLSSERERHHLAQQNLMKLRRENEMLEMSSPDPHTNPDPKQHGRRFVRAWDTLELSKAPPYREAYMRQRPDNGRQSNRPLSKSVMGFGPEYGHFEKDKRGISSPKSAPDTNSKFLENPYNDLSRNRYVLKPNREFQMPPYHPFGKAGGGAPRQDEQGNRVTQIMGLMDRSSFLNRKPDRKEDERMQDKIMKKKYRNELDQQVAQNMRKGTEQQRHQHEGQRDYAEIIDSSRRRPQSKHHLPRSDISLAKDGAVPLNRIEADKYRESLDEGFFAKQADRQLQRYKDNQESRQHVQQMTSYWGRYGGGYKKNEYTTHKGNLERLLNNEDGKGRFSMADVYVKGKDWSQFDEKTPRGDGFTSGNAAPHITPRFDSQDDVSPRYSRVTVDSYHANQYDYPHAVSTMKKDYEMRLPWAQH
ncbi:uncharacterized protein LOC117316392 isoform X19 [Pecten maximus]|uniref:uncharacterized protein LOC117316392 isoform X19 n=1 Tax=Pecten maximus TaxID=6579 RepID=UPI00145901D7|nr:uncharacterized protein LOC117316392 isoform X19 [Pecten maximus]